METRTYDILNEKRADVEKKLKRIQKKAQKYGAPFRFSFGEVYVRTINHKNENGYIVENKYELVDLTIESEVIKKGDFTVLAHIEHADEGNIVDTFNCDMRKEWATLKPFCFHCNSNHNLKFTFIVSDGVDEKQVGRTCLKDYCGIDPQMIGAFNQFFEEIEEYTSEGYDYSLGVVHGYDTDEILAHAIDIIGEQGYIKSEERDSNKSQIAKRIGKGIKPTEASMLKAKEMSEAIKAMDIETAVTALLSNVQTRIKGEFCKPSDFGYFAFAPLAYEKHCKRIEEQNKRKEEKAELGAKSEYVGEVGKRDVFTVKEMKLLTSWESMYGYTYLYQFIDINDNVLIWFASSSVDKDCAEVQTIKATVKDHSERDGVKQTIITRVKFS